MKQNKISTHDLCKVGLFAAIIAVMAQIAIPMPYGVPMTLQTLAIALAGILLGAKRGALAAVLYILIGAAGVPVFANFTGGLGIVFGPTGGFILSFPLLALAAGLGAEKSNTTLWIGLAAGTLFNYLCGVIYFSIYTSNDLLTSFSACVLFFIPTDVIKIIIAGLAGMKMQMILQTETTTRSNT